MAFCQVNDLYFMTVLLSIRFSRWFGSPWLRDLITRFVGWTAYRFSADKRRRACKGLEKAFGSSFSPREKSQILLSSFQDFWSHSFAILPTQQDLARWERAVVVGTESLDAALDRRKGVILLESNSFGCRMAAKHILRKHGFSVYQVHAENHLNGLRNDGVRGNWVRSRILKSRFERWESRFVTGVIYLPEDDSLVFTRTLLRRLAAGSIICSAGDGNMGRKKIELPFLGQTRAFATGMFSLSALAGASVLPIFCFEQKDERIRLQIGPEICAGKGQAEAGLASYVKQLEEHITMYPEQYRNWHF